MARENHMVAVLVLSGETKEAMLLDSRDRPDIVVDSVADLIDYV